MRPRSCADRERDYVTARGSFASSFVLPGAGVETRGGGEDSRGVEILQRGSVTNSIRGGRGETGDRGGGQARAPRGVVQGPADCAGNPDRPPRDSGSCCAVRLATNCDIECNLEITGLAR